MNAFSAGKLSRFMTQSIGVMTANPFPYTAKFIFVAVRNIENQQIRR